MAKFRMPWLAQPPQSEAESAKQKRRSFASFSKPRPSQESRPAEAGAKSVQSRPSQMMELARKIVTDTEKLELYLREHNLPEPSFDVDGPDDFPQLPQHLRQCREEVLDASMKLEALDETTAWLNRSQFMDTMAFHLVNHYGLARLVPLDSGISLAELEPKTPLDETNLARVLRHAITNGLFHEPKPGFVVHTAASRLLAQDTALQDWVGFNGHDVLPSAAKLLTALKEHPEAQLPTMTAFNFAFDTVGKESMYESFAKDGARAKRMGGAMASIAEGGGFETSAFVEQYDLSAVDERGGTLVDLGGSHGILCVELARRWKKISFVVQDLAKTIDSAPRPLCEDPSVAARVQLQEHDFFHEQPVKGADVYLFRWILHNYSTPHAVDLLRRLVPALKAGARVVINDQCLGESATEKPWEGKMVRTMDMVMLILLNAQERQEHEFRALFQAADERFVFQGVTRPANSHMCIIEAVWEP